MRISSNILTLLLIINILAACDTGGQNALKREALQEEMRNREPKKLTEAQIVNEAFKQGRFLSQTAQESLLVTLQAAIGREGVEGAVDYCNLQALPLMDSLSAAHKATIGRTSLQLRNPANAPSELEQQLLEAYQYNAEEGLPLEDNVQRDNQQYLLYTKPIVLGSELCLNCHGEAGKDIRPETLQRIDSLYPNDQARGYKKGAVRGMWSIRFQRKDIINAL